MPMPGPGELIIVLLIVVVIFGAGRLSEIGGALGKGIREFRSATKDDPEPQSPGAATQPAPPPAVAAPVAPAAMSPGENKCTSCGTVNPAAQTFCGQCGARLTVAA
jgi:sec-independent protein translocase protein TatA